MPDSTSRYSRSSKCCLTTESRHHPNRTVCKKSKKRDQTTPHREIDNNALNIQTIMNENKMLKRENEKLKDRMNKLKKLQLENNVLISGQPEEAWEPYERTKGIVWTPYLLP